MGVHRWTTEEIDFLRENIEGRRYRELTEMFNNHFDLKLKQSQVKEAANARNLYNGREFSAIGIYRKRAYTDEHIQFLSENIEGHSRNELTDMFNEHFKLHVSFSRVKHLLYIHGLRNGLKGGHIPGKPHLSKSRVGQGERLRPHYYRKGNTPSNIKPVGFETITQKGITLVKTSEPNTWRPKHRVVWESINGPLPKGYDIIFGDGDNRNFEPDNLLLMSRSQRVAMDARGLRTTNAELTKIGLAIADVHLKINKLKKNKGECI